METVKRRGYFGDGAGLWLQVSKWGKSWVFRFTLHGRAREMGLGSVSTFTLAEARERARQCRQLLDQGIDPIEHRDGHRAQARLEAAKVLTFSECAAKYIAAHRAGWKNAKHGDQWTNTLATYAGPIFGALPVHAIDTGLVMKVLEPLWSKKPETASRLRGRIESVLDWARVRGYRSGDNPARWRGHLDALLPARSKVRTVEHHAALPYAEMGEFMAALREQEGIAAKALEFMILTAARTGEVIGARWSEFDMAAKVWTVPAERMKARKEHRAPLSAAAVKVVEAMQALREGKGGYVFPGRKADKPLSNMAMLVLLRRMGRGDLTAHGFRSSFRDWAAEQTNYPREVAEMALAHTVGDKVEAAYRRGDLFEKRRALAADWARYCARKPDAPAKVIPIRKRAKAAR